MSFHSLGYGLGWCCDVKHLTVSVIGLLSFRQRFGVLLPSMETLISGMLRKLPKWNSVSRHVYLRMA
jgi:hypothetical protein